MRSVKLTNHLGLEVERFTGDSDDPENRGFIDFLDGKVVLMSCSEDAYIRTSLTKGAPEDRWPIRTNPSVKQLHVLLRDFEGKDSEQPDAREMATRHADLAMELFSLLTNGDTKGFERLVKLAEGVKKVRNFVPEREGDIKRLQYLTHGILDAANACGGAPTRGDVQRNATRHSQEDVNEINVKFESQDMQRLLPLMGYAWLLRQ